jgi:hypothetical protein
MMMATRVSAWVVISMSYSPVSQIGLAQDVYPLLGEVNVRFPPKIDMCRPRPVPTPPQWRPIALRKLEPLTRRADA